MSAGIMITVSGRYEEQTLSCQPLLPLQHTHTRPQVLTKAGVQV